jgi:hypothetical protein
MKHTKKMLVLVSVLGIVICLNAPAAQPVQSEYSEPGHCISDYLSPVKGKIGYTLISDYIFRGLNMSYILGGHKGRGNHELTYGLSMDLAEVGIEDVGELGITLKNAYLIAYQNTSANRALTDISISLTRPCNLSDTIDGTFTVEWRNYRWENQNTYTGGDERSQEFGLMLAFKDGPLIEAITGKDVGESVLNPTIKWLIDYEAADNGQLWMFGISHPFDLAEYMPELAGITLKPSVTMVVDNRYYGSYVSNLSGVPGAIQDTTKIAYFDWNLSAGADLTDTVGLKCGTLGIQGGIGFIHSVEKLASAVFDDTLYSYVSLVYAW